MQVSHPSSQRLSPGSLLASHLLHRSWGSNHSGWAIYSLGGSRSRIIGPDELKEKYIRPVDLKKKKYRTWWGTTHCFPAEHNRRQPYGPRPCVCTILDQFLLVLVQNFLSSWCEQIWTLRDRSDTIDRSRCHIWWSLVAALSTSWTL